MKMLALLFAFLGLGAAPIAAAGPGDQSDPIAAQLFPPEVVMQHRSQIGLSDTQRRSITGTISALQSQVLEAQWEMESAQQALVEMLGPSSVNEAAALAQVDRLMDIERRIKRAHLTALIRIKNALTREQQTKLRAAITRKSSGE